LAKILVQTANEKEQKIMWEKFKQSKFASKFKNAGTSRTVYITVITLLLALAVLITATAISNRAKKNKDKTELPGDPPVADEAPTPSEDNKGGNSPSSSTPDNKPQTPSDSSPSDTSDASGDKTDTEQTGTSSASVPELSLPVNGVIAKGHDNAIQVFSATTGDYRIHLGVDMTTEEDAPVMAAADGVISQIWDDALMGKCLAISHSGDCYTIYKNLSNTLPEDVTVGATVTAGQPIGTVGDTATLELAEEPHLHLEMTVKGLAVDPMDYFSAQALAAIGNDTSHEASASEAE
jgi:murein DD-endopeptidase MepM/ murein hydrolase activator NlpD